MNVATRTEPSVATAPVKRSETLLARMEKTQESQGPSAEIVINKSNQVLVEGARTMSRDKLDKPFKEIQELKGQIDKGGGPELQAILAQKEADYQQANETVDSVAKASRKTDATEPNLGQKAQALTSVEKHLQGKLAEAQGQAKSPENEKLVAEIQAKIQEAQEASRQLQEVLAKSGAVKKVVQAETAVNAVPEGSKEKVPKSELVLQAAEAALAIHQDEKARKIIVEREGKVFDRPIVEADLQAVRAEIADLVGSSRTPSQESGAPGGREDLEKVIAEKDLDALQEIAGKLDEATSETPQTKALRERESNLQDTLDYLDGKVKTDHLETLVNDGLSRQRQEIFEPESAQEKPEVQASGEKGPQENTPAASLEAMRDMIREEIGRSQEKGENKSALNQEQMQTLLKAVLKEILGDNPTAEQLKKLEEKESLISMILAILFAAASEGLQEFVATLATSSGQTSA